MTAFTLTSEVGYRPADFAVGELVKRHSPFGGFQYFVGGQFADESTIVDIPTPTPELLRKLEAKSRAWSRENSAIEAAREEKDNSFRTKRPHPVDLVNYVRKDKDKAFTKFCVENDKEDKRLMAERMAVADKLVERYAKEERNAEASRGRATVSNTASSPKLKAGMGRKRKAKPKKSKTRPHS